MTFRKVRVLLSQIETSLQILFCIDVFVLFCDKYIRIDDNIARLLPHSLDKMLFL
jgi:hypothetical protein